MISPKLIVDPKERFHHGGAPFAFQEEQEKRRARFSTGRSGRIAMPGDADYTFYRLKAEEFAAKADAEDQYENIRRAYRKLAEDYRKLAEEFENAPPLVPEQQRLFE